MTSEFLPGANNSELAAIGRGLEDVVLPDEAARWECPALGGDLLVQPPELCLRLQQLVACAPVFARLAGEVDIRVEEYFPPLVHVAWFALESHCFHPFLCSELFPLWSGKFGASFHLLCGFLWGNSLSRRTSRRGC